jgi:hypothetical protein
LFAQGTLRLPFQLHVGDGENAAPQPGSFALRLLELLANPDASAAKLAKTYGEVPAIGKVAEEA